MIRRQMLCNLSGFTALLSTNLTLDKKMKIRNIAISLALIVVSFIVGWCAGNGLGKRQGAKSNYLLLNRIASEAERRGDAATLGWLTAGERVLKQYDAEVEGRWLMLVFQHEFVNEGTYVQQRAAPLPPAPQTAPPEGAR
jgi:hypothetical protein